MIFTIKLRNLFLTPPTTCDLYRNTGNGYGVPQGPGVMGGGYTNGYGVPPVGGRSGHYHKLVLFFYHWNSDGVLLNVTSANPKKLED